MKKLCIAILLAMTFSICASAQIVPFEVIVKIKDRVIKHHVVSSTKVFLKTDSSTVLKASGTLMGDEQHLFFPRRPEGNLILEIVPKDEKNYDSQWIPFSVDASANTPYEFPTVYIEKKIQKKLSEVSVTATKVMFYNKGDTIVYNADAFVLAEGTMLDALIEQMPGVKMDQNGVITVNGKRVQNLLLNGKDMFNGNGMLMVENLPAYTVKNIVVYDKMGRTSELMGIKTEDMQYVMDVRLKRQYNTGGLCYADVGYGTSNSYLAKLFGMMFSDNVSIIGYGNLNNLSNMDVPGKEDGSWSYEKMDTGVKIGQIGGVSYLAKGKDDLWELKGNVDASHISIEEISNRNVRNFLGDKDNFNYAWKNSIANESNIKTSHTYFRKIGSKANLYLIPKISHTWNRSETNSVEATFDKEFSLITRDSVASIFDNDSPIVKELINREIRAKNDNGTNLDASMEVMTNINVKGLQRGTLLHLSAVGIYHSRKSDEHDISTIYYRINDNLENRDRKYKDSPDLRKGISMKLGLTQYFNYLMINLPVSYKLSYFESKMRSSVSDYDIDCNELYNHDDSYHIKEHNYIHEISISSGNSLILPFGVNKQRSIRYDLGANLKIVHREMEYMRFYEMRNKRVNLLPDAHLIFELHGRKPNVWGYFLNFNLNSTLYSSRALYGFPSRIPLISYLGNQDLKPTNNLSIGLSTRMQTIGKTIHLIELKYNALINDLLEGRYYNTSTGEVILRQYNVNGNNGVSIAYDIYCPINKRFTFKSNTCFARKRTMDLSTAFNDISNIDTDIQPISGKIFDNNVTEKLSLTWQRGQTKISAIGELMYNDYRSHDQGFQNFTSWTARYGATGVIALPEGFGLSTDLTVYTRRGFTDARLNTSDVVWNARLTKSIMKGNMTFAVDAYDMLRQLSNITYTVNAQARTEVVTNVVPAYVLFHVMYRFNHQPKRH